MRAVLSLAILAVTYLSAQNPGGDSGPTNLIVTYRCPPPRRAAFRQYMNEYGVQRFDRWKQDGILKEYKFLFNWYVDVDTWDAMAVLTFPDYAALARWKDIEKTSPGGLPRDAVDMAWPLNTYSADLVAMEKSDTPADQAHAIYFVVAYDNANFRDAVVPQAKAYLRDGMVLSYRVFVNRYPGGKRWQGLSILEYKDLEAFGRRRGEPSKAGDREPVIADSVGH